LFENSVSAANGETGIFIQLDDDLRVPDCLIDAQTAVKALSQFSKQSHEMELHEHDNSLIVCAKDSRDIFVQIPKGSAAKYPRIPEFPSKYYDFLRGKVLRRVVQFAGTDTKNRPDLQFLHVTSSYVEASDQDRIARVPCEIDIPSGVLIQKDIFRHWTTKNEVSRLGFMNGLAFVNLQDQFRYGFCQADTDFYALDVVLPERHYGYRVDVNVKSLMNLVKFATSASRADIVELTFDKGALLVAGLDDNGARACQNSMSISPQCASMVIVVRGRKLWQSLNVLDETTIELGYSSPSHPLRIHSEIGYSSGVWPLLQRPREEKVNHAIDPEDLPF
jgi:hypothetical protein